jgi:hypothetical protein
MVKYSITAPGISPAQTTSLKSPGFREMTFSDMIANLGRAFEKGQ